MTHYICINGPPRSGRSTLARLLQRRLHGSVLAEFHAPLKQLFCAGLAMRWENISGDNSRAVLNGRSSVDAIRQLRYHLRGVYGPDVLGKWLQFRILGMRPVPEVVIVDDALYPNDVLVLGHVTIIRVIRGVERNFTAISNPSYTVINANDVDYLAKRADQIVGTLSNGKQP